MNKQKVKKFLSTLKDKMSMFEILVRIKLRFKTTYYPTNNKDVTTFIPYGKMSYYAVYYLPHACG